MILHQKLQHQAVDLDERGHFIKELVLARGSVPLAMVRKRRASVPVGTADRDLTRGEADALAAPSRATVLLIHGYGQNRYAFHLPSRSLVNHLARSGLDVYNIDLRGHGRSSHLGARRPQSVHEFIEDDLDAALREIRRISGPEPVFLVGHSLGGIVAYGAACEYPDRVAGVVTLGTPYHFTAGTRVLAGIGRLFMALDRTVELPNLAVPARLYGSFVRVGHRVVNSRLYPIPLRGFHRGSMEPEVLRQHMAMAMDRGSIATMRAMFSWAEEARDRRHGRPSDMFGYAGRFEGSELPLLVVAGRHDDLAPPPSVSPAFERSRSPDKTYRELPFGHVDLLVGRDAPVLTWPLLEGWLHQRAGADARDGDGATAAE